MNTTIYTADYTRTTAGCPGVNPSVLTIRSTPITYNPDSKVGGPVGDHVNRIRTHRDASSNYSRTVAKIQLNPGSLTSYVIGGAACVDGVRRTLVTIGTGVDVSPVLTLDNASALTSKAASLAASSFASATFNALQAFSSGTFLGELNDSLGSILHPAKSLILALKRHQLDVKKRTAGLTRRYRRNPKGNRAVIRDITRIASESYLEVIFGIYPLISDLEDALRAHERISRKPHMVRVRAKGTAQGSNQVYAVSGTSPLGVNTLFGISCQRNTLTVRNLTVTVSEAGGILMSPTIDPFERFGQFGLHLRDFVPTAWELIPGSFIADYFSNINEILQSFSLAGTSFAYRTTATKTEQDNFAVVQSVGGASGNTSYELGAKPSARYLNTTYTRVLAPKSGVPKPDLNFEIPDIRRVINIAAVLGANNRLF